jgi:hypothetical protein
MTGPSLVAVLFRSCPPLLGDRVRAVLRVLADRGCTVTVLDEGLHGAPMTEGGLRICPVLRDTRGPDAATERHWWLVRYLLKRVPADAVLTAGPLPGGVVGPALTAAGLDDQWIHWGSEIRPGDGAARNGHQPALVVRAEEDDERFADSLFRHLTTAAGATLDLGRTG